MTWLLALAGARRCRVDHKRADELDEDKQEAKLRDHCDPALGRSGGDREDV